MRTRAYSRSALAPGVATLSDGTIACAYGPAWPAATTTAGLRKRLGVTRRELDQIAYIRSLMPAARDNLRIGDFAEKCAVMRREYGASETSGGRTDARSVAKGGFAGDPHNWDLGRDWTYETGVNRAGSQDHHKSPYSCPKCSKYGLKLIHEPTHDHIQPADFPAGPVADYAGERKTWV